MIGNMHEICIKAARTVAKRKKDSLTDEEVQLVEALYNSKYLERPMFDDGFVGNFSLNTMDKKSVSDIVEKLVPAFRV